VLCLKISSVSVFLKSKEEFLEESKMSFKKKNVVKFQVSAYLSKAKKNFLKKEK